MVTKRERSQSENRREPGRFELANGGTLFLDEFGNMTPTLQVKLLRALQTQEIERLGGTRRLEVDVRVIAATNQELSAMVKRGQFREDLYYRFKRIALHLPRYGNAERTFRYLSHIF